MRAMTEDQIPAFVQEIVGTGCDVRAVGDDTYVTADADLPEATYEAVKPELKRIVEKFGPRDHLRFQIAEYLHSIGRSYPPVGSRESLQQVESEPSDASDWERK